jgi:muconolactone delta-isomerase
VKFLVLWQLDLALLSKAMVQAVGDMPGYGASLEREGKLIARYHVVGAHGGAWIYQVGSHEEFERLLGRAPVFNFARYTIHALADMEPGSVPLQAQMTHAGTATGADPGASERATHPD